MGVKYYYPIRLQISCSYLNNAIWTTFWRSFIANEISILLMKKDKLCNYILSCHFSLLFSFTEKFKRAQQSSSRWRLITVSWSIVAVVIVVLVITSCSSSSSQECWSEIHHYTGFQASRYVSRQQHLLVMALKTWPRHLLQSTLHQSWRAITA